MRLLNRYQQSKLDAAFNRAFREDARTKQRGYCAYCDEPISARTVTADHVQAKAVYGLDHRNNIVAACRQCNVLKAHMPVEEFRKRLERPSSDLPLAFWMAWSRRRINIRLRRMAVRLGVSD